MSSSNRLIVAMLALALLGAAFWTQLLAPKREEAAELKADVERVEASLAQHRSEVEQAEAAREAFPADYRRLVVLGKAVPGGNDTASLLIQLNEIARRAGGTFRNISLSAAGSSGEAAPVTEAGASSSATEASAALLPLGASIGPAGLAVMPYEVTFDGGFFEIADFIAGLDSMVETGKGEVSVDGRLVTIDSFSLDAGPEGFPSLQASFSLTTYLTPPGEGTTGGAAPGSPQTATPVATTTGGVP